MVKATPFGGRLRRGTTAHNIRSSTISDGRNNDQTINSQKKPINNRKPWIQPLDIHTITSTSPINVTNSFIQQLSPPVTPPESPSPLRSIENELPSERHDGCKKLVPVITSNSPSNKTIDTHDSLDDIQPSTNVITFSPNIAPMEKTEDNRKPPFDFEAQFYDRGSDDESDILVDPEMTRKVKAQEEIFQRMLRREFPPGRQPPAQMLSATQRPAPPRLPRGDIRRVGCGLLPLRARTQPRIPMRLNRLPRIQDGAFSKLGSGMFAELTRQRPAPLTNAQPRSAEDEDVEYGFFARSYFQEEADVREKLGEEVIGHRNVIDLSNQKPTGALSESSNKYVADTINHDNHAKDYQMKSLVEWNVSIPEEYATAAKLGRSISAVSTREDVKPKTSELALNITDLIKKYDSNNVKLETKHLGGKSNVRKEAWARHEKYNDDEVNVSRNNDNRSNCTQNGNAEGKASSTKEMQVTRAVVTSTPTRRYESLRAMFENGAAGRKERDDDLKKVEKERMEGANGMEFQSILSSVTPSPSTTRSPAGESTGVVGNSVSCNNERYDEKAINLDKIFDSFEDRMISVDRIEEQEEDTRILNGEWEHAEDWIDKQKKSKSEVDLKRTARVHFVEEKSKKEESKLDRRRVTEGAEKNHRKRALSFGIRRKTTGEKSVDKNVGGEENDERGQRIERVVSGFRRKVSSLRNTWSSRDY